MARFKRRRRSRRSRRRRKTSRRSRSLSRTIKKVVLRTVETKRNGFINNIISDCRTVNEICKLGATISQGDKKGQRSGSHIDYLGVSVQWWIYQTNVINSNAWVRMFLLKANNKAALNTEELFQSASNTVDGVGYNVLTADLNQVFAKFNSPKWITVWDKKIRILTNAASSVGRDLQLGRVYIPLKYKQKYEEEVTTSGIDLLPQYRFLWFVQFDDLNTTRTIAVNASVHEYFKDP